jgi:hypothetical protein
MRRLIFLLTGSEELTVPNLSAAAALLLGFVLFIFPSRQAVYQDFIPLYAGAACLVHGHDPYSWLDQQQQLLQAGGPWTDTGYWNDFPIAYPPLTYVLLSPAAVLDWPRATLLWRILNILVFGFGSVAVIHATRPRFRWLAVLIVAAILATSNLLLALGQITLLDIGLLALGIALLLCNRWRPGFALLGLAVALKPQLGGLILAYFLLSRRTRWPAAATLSLLVLIGAIAGLWFSHHPQTAHWSAELRRNITAGTAAGGPMDSHLLDKNGVNQMLSLQQLTRSFSEDRTVSNAIVWVIAGLTGTWLLVSLFRIPDGYERDCFAIAAFAMLTLTPVYHRLYDMRLVLLTVPALVLVMEWSRRWGTMLLVLSGFLFFSTSLLAMRFVGTRGREFAAHHLVLQILLGRQQVLAVILLALAYTMLCWRLSRRPLTA